MSALDYTSLAQMADALIRDAGQLVTLTRNTAGAYNPATGTASVTAAVHSNIPAVKLPISASKAMQFGLTLDDATAKRREFLLMTGVGSHPAPLPRDEITISSVVWSVADVRELSPGGTAVTYGLLIER